MRGRSPELLLAVALVALVVLLYPRNTDPIEPQDLTVNGVELCIPRCEIEKVLGKPKFEKRTDTPTYGLSFSVSVVYDGSQQTSFALAVHGDELLYRGTSILRAGQSLGEAEEVLGSSLVLSRSDELQDNYPIQGTNIVVITANGSSTIRAFDSETIGPCLEAVSNKVPTMGSKSKVVSRKP